MSIPLRAVMTTACLLSVTFSTAFANPIIPYSTYQPRSIMRMPHAPPRPPLPTHRVTYADVLRARAAGWQQVEAPAPFGQNGAGTELLMTDGSVMVQDNTSNWYRLVPNKRGNYIEGRWHKAAGTGPNYGPLYFGSAVLADGKLIIVGGEYNFFNPAETNQGAIYDPAANKWMPVSPPPGYSQIGDASSVVLADGTFMLGNCCYSSQALLNEATMTWTLTGSGKFDQNSEEGWTLLPDGNVLAADVVRAPNSESYNPATGAWSSAGSLPKILTNQSEIGPQILRPNGTVFVAGADQYTAIYRIGTGRWVAGPNFPLVNGQQIDIADGPATLLTNGDVLMAASPGVYAGPVSMVLFDGKTIAPVVAFPNAPNDSSYNVRLLMLPTGQVMETDASDDVEIYTPRVRPDPSTVPVISSVPTTLTHGLTYAISGTLFNGVSQANAYGDDDQQATNYPLVRIQNDATGDVFYARTHDHSFMGVASMATVSTMFDVPATIELGPSTIVVVANGVASAPVAVTVK